jgi:hypothetical protein
MYSCHQALLLIYAEFIDFIDEVTLLLIPESVNDKPELAILVDACKKYWKKNLNLTSLEAELEAQNMSALCIP